MRRVKEGTSAVFLQSGLDEKWWADSMECYIYLRNIQDLFSDGKTPYGRRSICEKFKTSWQMGEHFLRDDSENHVKDRSFLSELWLNIFRFLRKTS